MKKTYRLLFVLSFSLLLFSGCNPQPDISADILDSGNFAYTIPDSLNRHLVSRLYPTPTELQKNTPVLIAAHGYSATTFEWDEYREYADKAKTFLVSQVLLGGHGTSFVDFKAATWDEWQASIREEYIALSNLGYKKIYLVGSSTGCPLIIQMFNTSIFADYPGLKGVFLIDPIIISSNKTLTLVGLLGPVLGYTTSELNAGEFNRWYTYRPQESLNQLMKLIDVTRRDLQKGIHISDAVGFKVYKSTSDDNADPASAVLIRKGIKFEYKKADVEMVDSKLHVFTRLRGREDVTSDDITNQQQAFKDMETRMLK